MTPPKKNKKNNNNNNNNKKPHTQNKSKIKKWHKIKLWTLKIAAEIYHKYFPLWIKTSQRNLNSHCSVRLILLYTLKVKISKVSPWENIALLSFQDILMQNCECDMGKTKSHDGLSNQQIFKLYFIQSIHWPKLCLVLDFREVDISRYRYNVSVNR